MPGSWKKFLLHLFFLDGGYNGAWWFLFAYTAIVLVSPFLLKCIKKEPFWLIILCSGILYCLSYYYRFRVSAEGIFLSKIGPLGMTAVEYVMGAVAAKYHYFTVLHNTWNRTSKVIRFVFSIIAIVAMLLFRTLVVPSLFVAPATGMVIISLFQLWKKPDLVENFFLAMGDHSTHIWLTHMFFYLYLFNGLVYKAVYPLFIFGFMIAITVPVSVVLNYIEEVIYSLLKL